jgi:hypothetical protein
MGKYVLICHTYNTVHNLYIGIVGRVGRATARDVLCCEFDPCLQRPQGVAVDFCPKRSGWLINQLGVPQFIYYTTAPLA